MQIYEIGEQDGPAVLAWSSCAGGSLDGAGRHARSRPRGAAELVEKLARAIHAAHQHASSTATSSRPTSCSTADGTPKITDFGLAKRLDDRTRPDPSGAVWARPATWPRSRRTGKSKEIGPAADIYAWAPSSTSADRPAALQGRHPLDTLDQVLDAASRRRRGGCDRSVPRDLETICLKCLHKEPANRYASAAKALVLELERFLNGEPILAGSPIGWTASRGTISRAHTT